MRRANSRFPAGPAALLILTLVLAAMATAAWGLTWWSFGVAVGGQLVALLWLATGTKVGDRGLKDAPLHARAQRERRRRLVAQLRDVRDADRKSTRLNSSHHSISYAVFCLK